MGVLNKFRWYFAQLLCPNCELQEGIVEEINSRLSPDKRIRNINVTWDFNYINKNTNEPIFNFSPEIQMIDTDATPSLFLAGRLLEGYGGRAYFRNFLKGYLERRGDIKKTYFDEYFGL